MAKTHDEWFGEIVQAVTATNAGDLSQVYRLASLLEAGEAAGVALDKGTQPAHATEDGGRRGRQRTTHMAEAGAVEGSTPAE